ncbi:hypothetical protein WA016_07665 [Myxococcus stipitatus]
MGVSERVDPEGSLRVVFSGLQARAAFSGGVLLGSDYIYALPLEGRERQLRENTSHPAFEWGAVHELIFEAGQLVEARDCSKAMAQARVHLLGEQLEPGTPAWQAELTRLMSQTFCMDYA